MNLMQKNFSNFQKNRFDILSQKMGGNKLKKFEDTQKSFKDGSAFIVKKDGKFLCIIE